MLRNKLFQGFALLVLVFSVLSMLLGVRTIQRRAVEEALSRVRLDLSSATAVYNGRMEVLKTIVSLAARQQAVLDLCEAAAWTNAAARARLASIRADYGLDFLSVVAPDGRVALRTLPPFAAGDNRSIEPAVSAALGGAARTCMTVLSRGELEAEGEGLADRAFLKVAETPHARRTARADESRGMVMLSAVPVTRGGAVVAALYGGILVNRNDSLVDRIHDVVYRNETYKGVPLGTATIFLGDMRVATTVRHPSGNRATGTRASKVVADRVLDDGVPWVGEAFVVDRPYLTAYDPIRDGNGRVIGMLYVGILKQPFNDYARWLAGKYLLVSAITLAAALGIAYAMAGRIAAPIHRLVDASRRMSNGEAHTPVPVVRACDEVARLTEAFNEMGEKLVEREAKLKALNRSYMETLGFVSHELKSPVATMMNYVFLMRLQKLGPLNERQEKALRVIDQNSQRLVEMVRHYLNLARIENGDMKPSFARVEFGPDVLDPLVEALETDAAARHMPIEREVPANVLLNADVNMVREVFENLVGNAIKYGREGGRIVVRAEPNVHLCRFAVRNEGDGIPADKQASLFQKFSRVDSGPGARRQKGTGLGLFIAKTIVEAHGGTIGVRSEPGGWTEFAFTFPMYGEGAERQVVAS